MKKNLRLSLVFFVVCSLCFSCVSSKSNNSIPDQKPVSDMSSDLAPNSASISIKDNVVNAKKSRLEKCFEKLDSNISIQEKVDTFCMTLQQVNFFGDKAEKKILYLSIDKNDVVDKNDFYAERNILFQNLIQECVYNLDSYNFMRIALKLEYLYNSLKDNFEADDVVSYKVILHLAFLEQYARVVETEDFLKADEILKNFNPIMKNAIFDENDTIYFFLDTILKSIQKKVVYDLSEKGEKAKAFRIAKKLKLQM